MRITKGRLKQIIKEELAAGGNGEAECAELQQSFDHAYNMFQSGDYTEDQFAEISTNLKKQAEFLVTSGRVGGCPMMTSKELEMSTRPISSVGGADVGFLTGALEEAKLGISEEQLKQIIKEEMAEVMSKKGREATMPIGRVGYDTKEKEEEATLKAVKLMSSRQPDGPIGVNTLKAAIASGDLATMINVINNAKRYMDKLSARYGVGGTMSPVRSWRKNSSDYGTDPERSADLPPEYVQYRTEKASEDLSRLFSFVG